jgi:hypothetical protein
VPAKTTRGPRVTGIQEATHIPAVLSLTVGGRAYEHVNSPLVNIFDPGEAIEEHVDGGDPFFGKAVWIWGKVSSIEFYEKCTYLILLQHSRLASLGRRRQHRSRRRYYR